MKKKILITTGGSGGHVLPALTIYDHLKTEYDMLISSDQRGLKYFETEEHKPIIVDTPKLKISIFFPIVIFKVLLLIIKSLSILKKKKNIDFNFNWWIYVFTVMFCCKNIGC